MNWILRILPGVAGLLISYVATDVGFKTWFRVQQNINSGDPTMLLGKYRLDGSYGYLVPCACWLVAIVAFVAGFYSGIWKEEQND